MSKFYKGFLPALALAILGSSGVASGQEVTLKGNILCAKCELKETPKCVTAIQVKIEGKATTYYLADKGVREVYHSEVCGSGSKPGQVTGTVMEKDGKKWITPTKVVFTPNGGASLNVGPNWRADYGLALNEAKKSGKPLAVFFAKGPDGWSNVARGGELPGPAQSILQNQYVSLYFDSDSEKGKEMAKAFEVPGGVGIVLSDKTAEVRAFHHCGTMTAQDLVSCLQRCCGGASATNCVGGNCGTQTAGAQTPSSSAPTHAQPGAAIAAGGKCCGRK